VRLLIGLGGNQGAVQDAFSIALVALQRHARVHARSGVWQSGALGPRQSDFLNAAVLLETDAHPSELLAFCRRIEVDAGRVRDRRWGPRPLDLDLLMAPGLIVETPALVLPHPRLAERRFALAPAAELAPDWVHPRLHRSLADLASSPALAAQRCQHIEGLGFGA
jgi:2-amino-4-hydroxy-6-hydroxymethyldihydropteridine diphosphokinase